MNTPPCVSSVSPYKGHRFPAEIISHSVWLYFRFSLSFRDVEEMMAERGVAVSYETIREWCQKFGCPQGGRRFDIDNDAGLLATCRFRSYQAQKTRHQRRSSISCSLR